MAQHLLLIRPVMLSTPLLHPSPELLRRSRDLLCKQYGLTYAEARVAALLLEGYGLPQCAELLSVTIDTVRSHLRNIFLQTSTHRQAEFVSSLFLGPWGRFRIDFSREMEFRQSRNNHAPPPSMIYAG